MTGRPLLTRQLLIRAGIVFVVLFAVSTSLSFDTQSEDRLRVFGSYWSSGWAASHQLNPYGTYPLTWVPKLPASVVDINLNPPTLLPLFELFARFDPIVGVRVWTALSAALFLAPIGMLLIEKKNAPQRRQLVLLFFSPAVADTLILGQVYMLLFALGVAGWLCLKSGRNLLAGVFIGLLVAAKPNFGVWPLFLLLAGHWRSAVPAVLSTVTVFVISFLMYGTETYQQWLVAIAGDRHAEIITTDVSVRGYFARLACEELGTGVAAALLAFLAIWVARRRLDVLMASKLGLVVAILASPLAWFHYTLLLLPALIERPWGKTLSLAACLLLVPIDVPLSSIRSSGLVLALGGGIYFGAVCLICWAFFREAWCAGAVQSDPGTPLRASLPDR